MDRGHRHLRHHVSAPTGPEAWERGRPLPVPMPVVWGDRETPVKAVRAVKRSQKCEPGWTPKEMAARQDADPDIGPIMRWKRAGNDRPHWEDISPESQGQGWRPQLVVPADRSGSLLQRFHGGMIGAHLGTARTLALAEQGFYWPGMRADVSRICNECDCAMLKRRRGRREPLHQYVVGVPMERLAMDVAGPYPVTSAGNQYSWWDATFLNGSSASRSRTRRPRLSLGSWYSRLWPDTELSESCIVTRARISGPR